MAMRGTRSNVVRPRVVARPVYEDFKPMFEWKREESSEVLIVYLPGFMKEHVNVTIEGRNIVRVKGERLVASNKWSRFREDYQIPDQCDTTGIRAKFERGILTITMSRKNIVPQVEVAQKVEPKTTQEALNPQQATNKPIPQKATAQEEKDQKYPRTPKTGDQDFVTQRPQNVTNDQKPKDGIDSSNAIQKEEMSEPKVKHREMSPKAMEKTTREEKKGEEKGKEPIKDENVVERKGNGESKGKGSEIERPQNAIVEEEMKSQEKRKKAIEGGNAEERKIKKEENLEAKSKETSTSEKGLGESKLEYYYKKVVTAKNEERQLLVNMGVAVLVIVALGAYVSYTYGSSNAKN
ncbi:hypothetical protein LguiA_010851 [Lonicera macranthoides]